MRRFIDAIDPICWAMWISCWIARALLKVMCHYPSTRWMVWLPDALGDFSEFLQNHFGYPGPWKKFP